MRDLNELLNRVATKEAAKAELGKMGKTLEELKVAGDAAVANNPAQVIEFVETLTGKVVNEDGTRNAFNYALAVVSLSTALAKLLVQDSMAVHPGDLYKACERTAGSIETLVEQLHFRAQELMADHLKGMNPVEFLKTALGLNTSDGQ